MRRALAILALARAYEVYENEYANDVLPGGRGDDDPVSYTHLTLPTKA